MPKVSVILPNFNHAAYLQKRIDSILRQTYRDFELIILDDCSTDQSKEVIEQYRNHPLVSGIHYNEKNSSSTFKQWSKGIQLAQGDYIWIAESDDFCEPAFLEELLPGFEKNSRLAVAFCQTLYVSPEEKITYCTHTGYLSETLPGEAFLKTRMLGTNTIVNASMAVFSRQKALLVPQDYMLMTYCGDWLFWVHLCFTGDVYISGKYLNYYLRHNNNVASSATRQGLDFLEGNRIFHFITGKTLVTDAEKKKALEERADEYLTTRYSLLNKDISKQVLESMLQLDTGIKGIIRKKIWKARVTNYAARFNKWLR